LSGTIALTMSTTDAAGEKAALQVLSNATSGYFGAPVRHPLPKVLTPLMRSADINP